MRPADVVPRQRASVALLRGTARELNRKYAVSGPQAQCSSPLPTSRRETEWRDAVGRQLNLGAALLSLSVLADSGVEHYRGSFQKSRDVYSLRRIGACIGCEYVRCRRYAREVACRARQPLRDRCPDGRDRTRLSRLQRPEEARRRFVAQSFLRSPRRRPCRIDACRRAWPRCGTSSRRSFLEEFLAGPPPRPWGC